jgi:hypothetical protein
MSTVISICLCLVLVYILFFLKTSKSYNPKNYYKSHFTLQTEIDLLTIELYELEENISRMEFQKRRIFNYNFPQRYFDYKRMTESLSAKIITLKNEIETIKGFRYYSFEDAAYLKNKIGPLNLALEKLNEQLNEMGFCNSTDKTPRGWYKLNEEKSLLEKKL